MKSTIIAIGISGVIVLGAVTLIGQGDASKETVSVDNVTMINGKQIITITAKGGYQPKNSNAKSNVPTILRIKTQGTFDCSSALVIPSIGYRKNLPPSTTTDIELPAQKAGTNLQGLCSMGMYNFLINFN